MRRLRTVIADYLLKKLDKGVHMGSYYFNGTRLFRDIDVLCVGDSLRIGPTVGTCVFKGRTFVAIKVKKWRAR